MELEWDCEGCGYHVIALGMDQIPAHRFCSVCAFLCEFVDPAELDSVMGSVCAYHSGRLSLSNRASATFAKARRAAC